MKRKGLKMTKLILLISLFMVFISRDTVAQSKKVDRLRQEFIDGAIHTVNNQKTSIIKWEEIDTLRYHIDGHMKFISKKGWNKFIEEVGHLIEIPIIETTNPSDANIHIYFGELKDYMEKFNKTNREYLLFNNNMDNWSSRRFNNQKQLITASYCIDTSNTKTNNRGVRNIKKLFLQSLGLLGEIDSRSSLFNNNKLEQMISLGTEDKRLIKILYSNSIRPGMNVDEVHEAFDTMDMESLLSQKL